MSGSGTGGDGRAGGTEWSSADLNERLARVVPSGAHAYAKAANQWPDGCHVMLDRGSGADVWSVDGDRYVDWFMGLSSVSLGHAHPAVGDAIMRRYQRGTNFQLPTEIELRAAELFATTVARADMVKFTKDGSAANDAALRLARHATGRQRVARCAQSPFLSYHDWFIGGTAMSGGCLPAASDAVETFTYNDLGSVEELFARFPGEVAAVILEPYRFTEPAAGFLRGLRDLCDRHGAVLIFDEVVSGLKYTLGGAQHVFGVRPHLSTWGKGLANGLPLAALSGTRELMELGDSRKADGPGSLFLLSTTHGGEAVALAAMTATVDHFRTEGVNAHLDELGAALRHGITEEAHRRGLGDRVRVAGRSCFLTVQLLDADGGDNRWYRTQFYRSLIRRGVLYRGIFCGSASHGADHLTRTLEAVSEALDDHRRFLEQVESEPVRTTPADVPSPVAAIPNLI